MYLQNMKLQRVRKQASSQMIYLQKLKRTTKEVAKSTTTTTTTRAAASAAAFVDG
jgi:hypothetical protein